jgi:cation transport ATPase
MNLLAGLGLNVVAIILASSGILSPMLGALVHNLGSAFVVGNSARFATFGKRVHDDQQMPSTTDDAARARAA